MIPEAVAVALFFGLDTMTSGDPAFDEDLQRVALLFRRGKGADLDFKVEETAQAIQETGMRKSSCRSMRWLQVAPEK